MPCLLPPFDVVVWGDYPAYLERVRLAVHQCNIDLQKANKLNDADTATYRKEK